MSFVEDRFGHPQSAVQFNDRFTSHNFGYMRTESFRVNPDANQKTFTFAAWIHKQSWFSGNNQNWIVGENHWASMETRDSGKLTLTIATASSRFGIRVQADERLPENEWVFIAGSLSLEENGTFHVKLFVNGDNVKDVALSSSQTPSNSSACGTLFIGGSSSGRTCSSGANFLFIRGRIDDVRIYDRALSDSEIQALYHEGGWPGN